MSQTVVITITTGSEAVQSINNIFLKPTSDQREESRAIENYFEAAGAGLRQCSYDVQVNGGSAVAASDTVTFSGTGAASDTLIINGVTFTAVASGATGNQWNVGASATNSATAFKNAVNASATALVSGQVVATSASGVVTLTALVKGVTGNAITFAKGVDSTTAMTVASARLTGGVAATANVYHLGQ